MFVPHENLRVYLNYLFQELGESRHHVRVNPVDKRFCVSRIGLHHLL
jgi:hypothetical protein